MKPDLSDNYIFAVEMAKLGFRKKLISHVSDLPDLVIKDIIFNHKDENEKYKGRLGNSDLIIKDAKKLKQAINFMLIYLEIADEPEKKIDSIKTVEAYKIYRKISEEFSADEILSGTECWILARDYRADHIRVKQCRRCKFYSLAVENKVWHSCPFCKKKIRA